MDSSRIRDSYRIVRAQLLGRYSAAAELDDKQSCKIFNERFQELYPEELVLLAYIESFLNTTPVEISE